MEVYLDNSATTRVFPEVAEHMKEIMCGDYGNPSSMHMKGVEAENHVKEARDIFAKILKAEPSEILFTSGGTESDNMALIGVANAKKRAGNHIITTVIEHPAILRTCEYLESNGFEITYLPVGKDGRISLKDLKEAIRPETILVSVMHTNNEVGSVMPIAEAGELIKKINPSILFHVDAVQGFGKAVIVPKKMNIDLLSVSSHKIHGPKGMGILYINKKVKINPILFGGGQQNNLRSGTENVPGIAGMAMAAKKLYDEFEADIAALYDLKKYFIEKINEIDDTVVNGLPESGDIRETAPHIVSVSFKGVRSEVLLHSLEEKGIYVSAGSACSTHKRTPSQTLVSIGVDKSLYESTIRFSFSVFTTREELDYTLQVLGERLPILRKYARS